jgi:hypothetical protein
MTLLRSADTELRRAYFALAKSHLAAREKYGLPYDLSDEAWGRYRDHRITRAKSDLSDEACAAVEAIADNASEVGSRRACEGAKYGPREKESPPSFG